MNVWTRFQDPAWRKASEQQQHKNVGMMYDVKPADLKPERQHKLKVKDWLFKNNLTEELLLNHPSPADIKLFQEIRRSNIYDYFDSSDIAMLGCIEERIVIRRQSLKPEHLDKINHAVVRAERLYKRGIKRQGILNGKQKYLDYKEQVKKVYQDAK